MKPMPIKDLITRNRSYRRFNQSERITLDTLKGLVNLARLSPSGANLQPLKYVLTNDEEGCAAIFPHLTWAGHLKDWPGPAEGERPAAYIIIVLDHQLDKKVNCDHGIAAQSILLGATELGLGGCMMTSVNRKRLVGVLKLDERYEILMVLALGRPAEEVVIEDMGADGNYKYWRGTEDKHHVPKRPLKEMILE